jgi:exodeoxyribonuclease VII small subunit
MDDFQGGVAPMNNIPSEELTFEQSLAQLEQIVRDLEDAQLGLDEALGRYEQGVSLVKRCQAQLQQAEQRILLLTGLDETGQPVLQGFKHEATASIRVPSPRLKKPPADDSMF